MRKQAERIIHLDDMLSYIIKQWKIFVTGLIVVSIVFGSMGLYKVNKKYVPSDNDKKVVNTVAVNVSDKELANIEMIFYLEEAFNGQKEYNENSLLMEIDPYEKNVASVKYQFQVAQNEDSTVQGSQVDQGAKAYQNIFDSEEIYQFIIESNSLDTNEKYIKELINTEMASNGMVAIYVCAPDGKMAQGICDSIKDYFEKYSNNILKNYKDLNVKIDSEYITTVVDTGLQGTQAAQYNNAKYLQTQLDGCYLELSDNAKQYLELAREARQDGNYESGQTLYKKIVSGSDKQIDKSQKIYDVGIFVFKRIILFIFLAAVFFALKYMWSSRLIYAYDLRDMYGIKVIDVLAADSEESLSICAEKIMGNLNDTDHNTLLMISSSKEQLDSVELKALVQKLKEKITVKLASETEDISTIRLIKENNNIIFFESIGESRYIQIEKNIRNVRSLNKDVKGVVIIKEY